MGTPTLADALRVAGQVKAKTRPERVRDEIMPILNDDDRAALVAALASPIPPVRIVDALKTVGVSCSEGAVRHYRKHHAAS